jgi:hypothetical protein
LAEEKMPKQKMMLVSKTRLETLILTFSLREKEPSLALGEFSLRKKRPPLPLGEGWGEGNSIFENDRGRRDTQQSLASLKIIRRAQTCHAWRFFVFVMSSPAVAGRHLSLSSADGEVQ